MLSFISIVVGLVAAVGLLVWTLLKKERTIDVSREEVAKLIEDFLDGRGSDEDWDGFLRWPITDPFLDSIRMKCLKIYDEKSGVVDGRYRREKDVELVRGFLAELRSPNQPAQTTPGLRPSVSDL